MLRIWLSGRSQLALSALYNTSRLVSSSRLIPSNSCRSRCAMKRNQNCRLVMFAAPFHFHIDQWLRHFAEQVIIKHFSRDGCRYAAAVSAVLGQHHQRDFGLFGRGISDEPCMIAKSLVDIFNVIFFALLHGCLLYTSPSPRD